MKPLRLALAFFVLAAAAPTAGAQPKAPAIIEQERTTSDHADELFRSANALAKKDRWRDAAPLFREAFALKRSYDIAGNLGIAEASLGQWRDAAEHLTFALRSFPANGKAEHKKLLETTLARALPQVTELVIDVSADKAEIFVDGRSAGVAPISERVFVEPGTRAVEARRAGYATARRTIEAVKGQTQTVTLVLTAPVPVPSASATGTGTSPPPSPPRAVRVGLAVASGVLAAGGLGAGIGLTVAANGKSGEAATLRAQLGSSSACTARPAPSKCGTLQSAAESKTTLGNGAIGAFVAGGVLALAAVGLGVWAAATPNTAIRLAPSASGQGGGVVISGTW